MWTIPSYSGQEAYGPSGALKVGMFELTKAINEREDILGISLSTWYKANGSLASNISSSDLEGMEYSSSNYVSNLNKIYTKIRALCPYFLELSSGLPVGQTMWSVSSLEAELGSTLTPSLSGMSRLSSSIFEIAQAACDLLTYVKSEININSESDAPSPSNTEFSGSYRSGIFDSPSGDLNTAQAAWDALGTYNYSTGSRIGTGADIHGYSNFLHGVEYDASRKIGSQNISIDFTYLGFSFPTYKTYYYVTHANGLGVDIGWSFGGASGSAAHGTSSAAYYEGDIVDLDTPSVVSLSTSLDSTLTVPGTPPTTTPASVIVGTITPSLAQVIYDISSALSDQ